MRWLLLLCATLIWAENAKQVKEAYQKMYEDKANAFYGQFSLHAHRANYYLPLSVSDTDYRSFEPSETYQRVESQLQLSVRFDLFYDLFGFEEIFSLAYTQQAFWQNYTASSPFRETLYNPEAFFLIPLTCKDLPSLKTLTLGYGHQSNGQGITYDDNGEFSQRYNRSRTWNYLYAKAGFWYGDFGAEFQTWWRILKTQEDATPDLYRYLGYGDIRFRYVPHDHWMELMLRYNPASGYGALEASYSYPIWFRDDVFWYVKFFEGYAESLIDYDTRLSVFSVGISFSR
jgi:phospholipase A1